MNKRIITTIICGMLVCSAFASCNNNDQPKTPVRDNENQESVIPTQPDKEHFHFLERDDKHPLTIYKEIDGEQVTLIKNSCEKVSFVAYDRVDSEAAKAMNDKLDKEYNNLRGSSQQLSEEIDAYFSQENVDLSVFPWETKAGFSCTKNDGKAISITETIDYYSAGLLEGTTVRTLNFDPMTGKSINNIFYEVGDSEGFNAIDNTIYTKLIEKYGSDSGITYEMPYLTSMVDEAINCWYFTETGIRIVFNPGSIAPVEKGGFELELSKDELPEESHKYF